MLACDGSPWAWSPSRSPPLMRSSPSSPVSSPRCWRRRPIHVRSQESEAHTRNAERCPTPISPPPHAEHALREVPASLPGASDGAGVRCGQVGVANSEPTRASVELCARLPVSVRHRGCPSDHVDGPPTWPIMGRRPGVTNGSDTRRPLTMNAQRRRTHVFSELREDPGPSVDGMRPLVSAGVSGWRGHQGYNGHGNPTERKDIRAT